MIRLSKSVVGKAESAAVSHIIEDIGYLGMGGTVGEFENALETYIGGGRRCICVNSGTAALHLAIQAVTKPGDEVLVPSFTFVASYQAVTGAECRPVSCDINPVTLTLDLKDAERRITSKTTAMMPVYYGSNCQMAKSYQAFAREHGLRLIEDAAHAIGSIYADGTPVGNCRHSDMTVFSFHPVKTVTCAEGGAVTTNDPDLHRRLLLLRTHGITKDPVQMTRPSPGPWYYEMLELGYNYRISDIEAAIGFVENIYELAYRFVQDAARATYENREMMLYLSTLIHKTAKTLERDYLEGADAKRHERLEYYVGAYIMNFFMFCFGLLDKDALRAELGALLPMRRRIGLPTLDQTERAHADTKNDE